MKKVLLITSLLLIIIIIIKYYSSNYELNYIVDNHEIYTKYKNGRYYIEIDDKYNFDIYKNRGLKKLKINKIEDLTDGDIKCVIPSIKNIETYPLCYEKEIYKNYNLIKSNIINKYKDIKSDYEENFTYNKNLNDNEYVLVWNYKGFYKLNGNEEDKIDIIKNDKYDSSLINMINGKIVFPNYDEEYLFKSFYSFNIKNSKYELIENKYEIDYNSYVVGNINNKEYFYDIKNSRVYEINISNNTIKLVGNEEKGYTKYKNGKIVKVLKNEYKNKSIKYKNKENSNYKYVYENNNLYRVYNDNQKLKELIFSSSDINIVKEYENNLFFTSGSVLYKYENLKLKQILSYFELNFNKNNNIFIYIE